MPKVTEEYRDAKREEITAAAVRAFKRKGFQATSMADIIAESGMSAGAIYGHFRSKNEIIIAAGTKVIGNRVQDLSELAEATPMPLPGTLVRLIAQGMLDELGDPSIMLQLWGEAVTEPELLDLAAGVVARLRAAVNDYLIAWHRRMNGLDHDAAKGAAEAQVPLYIAASQGFIVQRSLARDFDADSYFASVETYLPR